jgi:secondary thiamine-phosphate synthase enzyme
VPSRAERVLDRVRATPPGFVRAYGDISPGAPRFAGAVLSDCDDPSVPWHRIVRADGSLAKGARQRALLEAEGVPFRGERVDMRMARLPAEGVGAMWVQRQITLRPRPRGFHLVTDEVESAIPELRSVRVGLAHLFIRHTSASLTLNENASPDVRRDFEAWFHDAVPEDAPFWTHTIEGPDDMPAHIKASLLGPSLTVPVSEGRLALGTWQGVYLCEHREHGGARSVVVTVVGEG